MEEPPSLLLQRLLVLLLLLVSVSCLFVRGSAATASLGGVGDEAWSSSRDAPVDLRNIRISHSRRLLQIGGGNQIPPQLLSPTRAPDHKRHRGRRRSHAPTPSPAPSPSPFISPPKASPSPSPTPHLVRPLPSAPQPNHDPQVDAPVHASNKHSWRGYGMVIAGSSVFLVMAVASVVYCRAKKVGTVKPWVTGLSGQLQRAFVTGVPSLKRSELEAACEDFSNIIGSTASCMLYKGTLSSGVEIAVVSSSIASAKDWSKECESQYRKKISSLSKVGHKNFMNLLGYCEEENPFTRAMVFEYAPNGTLFEHLHVREAENLDWMARLRISMGIAYCLEHMHKLNPPAVPRNFSSKTIYLTDDYAAKVSDLDFWNGRKGSDSVTDDCTMLDTDSIVHQYGIILLETLTGRAQFPEQDLPLEKWASLYFEGKMPLAELIDSSLGAFPEEAAAALCDVARSCIDPDPSKRPQMAQVAARMKEITSLGPEGATPKVSPLWWAELEIMSGEAS
ncbi:protein MALE DISCOVERER 2 [Lolium perenne]|uniref:protein MALE DISCOVERER 2 n=1 Tax=Lolium perenne TaxID=4522 RepID=UPI0021F5F432|nr:protein MALE DISCOVERER 2-like [Lolium perenne]